MAKVYIYNEDGYYAGVGESIPHPFNLGEDSLPNNSTYLEVPEEKEGNLIRHYDADGELPERWSYEKILTESEQKIAGQLSLVDGEYVEDGELITLEAPSILHTWNAETHAWDIDPEKVERMRYEHYKCLSLLREEALDKGYYFEEGKLLKGDDRALIRSQVVYTAFKDQLMGDVYLVGDKLGVTWKYDNGAYEFIDSLERIKKVFSGVSSFINVISTMDGMLKLELSKMTDWEVILAFDPHAIWTQKYNEMLLKLVPPVEETVTV